MCVFALAGKLARWMDIGKVLHIEKHETNIKLIVQRRNILYWYCINRTHIYCRLDRHQMIKQKYCTIILFWPQIQMVVNFRYRSFCRARNYIAHTQTRQCRHIVGVAFFSLLPFDYFMFACLLCECCCLTNALRSIKWAECCKRGFLCAWVHFECKRPVSIWVAMHYQYIQTHTYCIVHDVHHFRWLSAPPRPDYNSIL